MFGEMYISRVKIMNKCHYWNIILATKMGFVRRKFNFRKPLFYFRNKTMFDTPSMNTQEITIQEFCSGIQFESYKKMKMNPHGIIYVKTRFC